MVYSLAFIGAAGHAQLVLDHLPDYPSVRCVAFAPSFAGEDVSLYARPAQLIPTPQAFDDWRALLDRARPDIVVVCGRYDLNAPIAIEAARRGCHVLSEKPAALTLEDVAKLRQAVTESGVAYTLMLSMRYEAPYFTAHELVREGVIGEPLLISAQKSYRWGRQRPVWYGDAACYGNTMTWVGIHVFDLARWVGGVAYDEVYAYHANLLHTERAACQDVATVIARLANGGSAVFNLDYVRPDAAPTHGDDRLRIAGSRGVLEVCDLGARLHVITADRDVPAWALRSPERTLLGDLMDAIEGRAVPLVPASEAWEITEFAIRAGQAADKGVPQCMPRRV
jgi:predicted dehydrogenase